VCCWPALPWVCWVSSLQRFIVESAWRDSCDAKPKLHWKKGGNGSKRAGREEKNMKKTHVCIAALLGIWFRRVSACPTASIQAFLMIRQLHCNPAWGRIQDQRLAQVYTPQDPLDELCRVCLCNSHRVRKLLQGSAYSA